MRKRSNHVRILMAMVTWLATMEAQGKVNTRRLEYTDGPTRLAGYLAFDDTAAGRRPGVLVVHEWWGLNDFARKKAEQVAELGYVALAVDLYGDGLTTSDREEAARLSGQFKSDPARLRRRIQAGLEALAREPNVDAGRIAAIGFCFGGTTVLQLAYSGADVAGVVSFHGGLAVPAAGDRVRTRILVLHGADDPFIPPDEIERFQKAMREVRADWQMVYYGNAVHSFTNPDARGEIPGAQYDPRAAQRSWEHMRVFLREVFGES